MQVRPAHVATRNLDGVHVAGEANEVTTQPRRVIMADQKNDAGWTSADERRLGDHMQLAIRRDDPKTKEPDAKQERGAQDDK
jgi:hypothetical protein